MPKVPVRVSQNTLAGHIDISASLEIAKELTAMLREAVIIHATESHGQDILFAETPSVAAHVATKVKFRQFAGNAAASRVRCGHLHFYFARDDRRLGGFV